MIRHFTYLVLILLFLLFFNREGLGQNLNCQNNNGAFSISQTLGCDSLITVTNRLTGAQNVEFYFDFNGRTLDNESRVAANANGSASFTYKKPGKFKILQIGSINGEGFFYCSDIEIINTQSPVAWVNSCSSGEAQIVFADFDINTQYDRLGIIWGDGSPIQYIDKGTQLTRSHLYSRNGNYPISVFGEYTQANCSAGRPLELGNFTVGNNTDFEQLALNRVEVTEDDEIKSSFHNNNGATATLQVKTGTGNYQNTQASVTTDGNLTLMIPEITAANNQNIRLLIEDLCKNQLIKNEITVVNLTVVNQGEQNLLNWSRNLVNDEFSKYELYKNDQLLETFTSITETSFTDESVACGETITYKVIAYQQHAVIGEITSHSKTVSISGTHTQPSPPAFVTASVENNTVNLAVTLTDPTPEDYKIIINRLTGATFQEVATLNNQLTYSDQEVNPQMSSYCYQTVFENACGSQSVASEPVCSIFLSTQEMEVQWTSETPFTEQPIGWAIEKTINGQTQLENTNNSNEYNVADDLISDGRPTYRIIATAENGGVSYSNIVQYQKGVELYFPTAFTPNNDQQNDVYLPIGNIYDQFRMIIYNRWGKPLFVSENANMGWDGMIDGNEAPPGNYTYLVEIQKASQLIYRKTGTFLLIR